MKKNIYVSGMHCVSCEKILEDELGQVPLVESVKSNCKTGRVEISYSQDEPNRPAMEKIIEKLGYSVAKNPSVKAEKSRTSLRDWLSAILVALVILLVIKFVQGLGIIPSVGTSNLNAGLGVSLLIGVAASMSSCLAVVGGVIIAFSEKYQTSGKGFWEKSVWPNLSFHIGRAGTFFVLGGLLGLLGAQINISGQFLSFYTIFIAVVMLLLALNILGFAPSVASMGLAMPKSLTRHWGALKDSNHSAAPFVLGGLSFFLPCGFTQSMQLFALASGSFWTGGFVLLFFALGTLPVLLALGVATSWTKNRHAIVFQKAAGILILIFSFYTLSSGWAIHNVQGNIFSTNKQAYAAKNATSPASDASDVQIVRASLSEAGFDPATIKIKKGVPVKWIINGDHAEGCADKVIIPSLNILQNINPGDNVITFTPTANGKIPFSCWMGMVRGKFVVE